VTLVKVCGIRSVADGRAALEAGADWLGFIFWRPGKRYVAPSDAAEIIASLRCVSLAWSAVGVFVDPAYEDVAAASEVCGLDYVQLSGHEGVKKCTWRPHVPAGHTCGEPARWHRQEL
jgi:phosphoribosylanthranilate isomerase